MYWLLPADGCDLFHTSAAAALRGVLFCDFRIVRRIKTSAVCG